MRYGLLIYDQPGSYEGLVMSSERASFASISRSAGIRLVWAASSFIPSVRLRPCGCRQGRALTTDGPFADTKEVFGGFYVFEAENLAAVLDVAARISAAWLGGSVEIRPVVDE
jgi:hypothetical protein